MLENIDLKNILFLDTETVPAYSSYNDLPETYKKLWDRKTENLIRSESLEKAWEVKKGKFIRLPECSPEKLYKRAGIYSEFGKIICISVGRIFKTEKGRELNLKSFSGDDEKQLLSDFAELLNKKFNTEANYLCSHNGKEFDFPYISRRMLINDIKLPKILDIHGLKPWEIHHLDTMELWKFGDYKGYTSLELLATIFNITNPKKDMDGSNVADVYWKEKNLNRIVSYCQRDVITIAQIFLKLKGEPLINADAVKIVE